MNLLGKFSSYLLSLPDGRQGKKTPSKATVKNYRADVGQFITWLEATTRQEFDPSLVTPETLTLYKTEKNISPRSLERHFSSLRKFFHFCKLEGAIASSPFEVEKAQQGEKPDPWHLKDFKNNLYVYNTSNLTIKNYVMDVRQFLRWIEEVSGVQDAWDIQDRDILSKIDNATLNEYKQRLLEGGIAPSSINRKLSSLRRYIKWAQSEGLISSSPVVMPNSFQHLKSQSNEILKQVQDDNEKEQLNNEAIEQYSKIPPLRLLQKTTHGLSFLFDAVVSVPIAKGIGKTRHLFLKTKGQHVFREFKSQNSKVKTQNIGNWKLEIGNYRKEMYAPLKISTKYFPLHKKMWFHLRHTRPVWYRKYHSYPVVHYFHFAILAIFAVILALSAYRALIEDPSRNSLALAAPASPPRILSFQGRLTDASDNPITTANTNLRMAVYSSSTASGAALLWQEIVSVSPDQDGIFSILLGNDTTIPQSLFAENASLWLGVTVRTDPELTPRQQLATVAYATNAEVLQGLPPITDSGVTTNTNAVLALNSSGVVAIAGSATTTFQQTSGQITIEGRVVALTTASGSDTNIQFVPDDLGKVDIQKPIQNTSNNNNVTTAVGAVEVNDLFAILATSSGQSAFTLNQTSTGPLISASASGVAKFTVGNDGSGYFAGNVGIGTTALSRPLHVYGDIPARFDNTAGSSNDIIELYRAGSAAYAFNYDTTTFNIRDMVNNKSPFQIEPNAASSSLYIRSTGNVGIGDASPDASLEVVNDGSGDSFLVADTNDGDTTPFVITSDGNVGVGTATAGSFKLQVSGNVGPSNDATYDLGSASLRWNNIYAASIIGTGSGVQGFWEQTNGALYPTNQTVDLLFGGTATSSARFRLAGLNSGTAPVASIAANSSYAGLVVDNKGNGDIFTASSSGLSRFVINQAGSVGIGTNMPTGMLHVLSSATALQASGLGYFDWSPSSSATSANDLFTLNVGSNGTLGNIFNIKDAGSSVFSVSQTAFTTSLPSSFTSSGDVSIAYDLNFTNPTASYIKSSAPLYVQAGPVFGNNDLTFNTYGTGGIIVAPQNTTTTTSATQYAFQVVPNLTSATNSLALTLYGIYSVPTINESGTGNAVTTLYNNYIGLTKTAGTIATYYGTYIAAPSGSGTVTTGYALVTEATAGNVGIGTTAPVAQLDVRGNIGTAPVASFSGTTAQAALIVNNNSTTPNGDLFTASTSGLSRFVIKNNGNVGIGTTNPGATLDITGSLRNSGAITFSTFTSNGGVLYANGSGILAQAAAGTATQCLLGGTSPSFGSCASGGVDVFWNQTNGALYPNNSTVDLLIGAQATTSAKFAVLNVNSGTPVASVSSGLSGTAAFLTADGTLATQNRMSLTIGNSSTYNTTGNVLINPNGTGNVGIGTTSPGALLDVVGGVIHSSNTAATGTAPTEALSMLVGTGISAGSRPFIGQNADGRLYIGSNRGSAAGGLMIRNASADRWFFSDDGIFRDANSIYTFNPAAGNGAVFNETGIDLDFRVESDTNANFMHLDAGNFSGVGSIGFGVAARTDTLATFNWPATTAAANTNTSRVSVLNSSAITVPTGTTDLIMSLEIQEPNITATGTVNNSATLYIGGAATEATNNYALFVDAGTTRFDGDIILGGATVGNQKITSSDNDVSIYSNGTNTLTISGNIVRPSTDDAVSLGYNDGSLKYQFQYGYFSDLIFINENANANMTTGLTINQGTNDDEILSFKSSTDIAHGMSSITETDTYALFHKNSATAGGLEILAPVENSSTTTGLRLYTLTTGDTTKTTSSVGAIQLWSALSTGGGGGQFTDNGNIVVIGNNSTNQFIFDEDGDMWLAGDIESLGGTEITVNESSADVDFRIEGNNDANLFFTDAGNDRVGIGTNAPVATLDVRGLSGTTPVASISGTTAQATLIVNNNSTTPNGDIFTASTSGLARFTIKNNGDVGIGTTLPGQKLEVAGNILLKYNSSSNPSLLEHQDLSGNVLFALKRSDGVGGSTGNDLVIRSFEDIHLAPNNSDTALFTLKTTGNVGIGTTNPASFLLQTAGSVGPETDNTYDLGSAALRWKNIYGVNIVGTGTGIIGFWEQTSGALYPANQTVDLLYGGTSTASARFRLAGLNSGTSPVASIAANTSFAALVVNNNSTVGDLFTASSSGLNRFVIKNNGDVGIGTTTPARNLHVYDNSAGQVEIRLEDATANSVPSYAIINDAQTFSLQIRGDDNDKFSIRDETGASDERFSIDPVNNIAIFNDPGNDFDFRIESDTNANAFVVDAGSFSGVGALGFGGAVNTTSFALMSPTFTTGAGTTGSVFRVAGSMTGSAGESQATFRVSSTITEAGSSTHPILAGLYVDTPTLTDGVGATTNTASLYIQGAPTGITPTGANYALFVDAGNVRLDALASVGRDILTSTHLAVGGTGIAAGTTQTGLDINTRSGSDATTSTKGIEIQSGTAAAAYTTTNLYNILVQNASAGAGSTITNQYGLYVANQTTGGTSDYGIYVAGADTYALWVDAGTSRFDGDLTVDGDLDFTGPQEITTSTGDLTLNPGGNVVMPLTNGSDKLLIGHTAALGGNASRFEITGNQGSTGTQAINFNLFSASEGESSIFRFNRSSHATIASHTALAANTLLGEVAWAGSNGTAFVDLARIRVEAPSLHASGDQPVEMSFWTTPDASAGIAERMRITNAGDIGIGTTAPVATLDVRGNLGTAPVASISGNTAQAALIVNNNSTTANGDIFTASASGLSRFVIKNNGNVGIGTDNPVEKLQVAGALKVTGAATTNLAASFTMDYTTMGRLLVNGPNASTNGTITLVTQRSDGTNALTGLTINASGEAVAASLKVNGAAQLNEANTGAMDYNARVNFYSRGANASTQGGFRFATQSSDASLATNALEILGSGNVGIGTTTPTSFKLETAGSIGPTATNTYDLGSSSRQWNNIYGQNIFQNGVAMTQYWTQASGALYPANSTVDLLIGGTATSSASFHVYGAAAFQGTNPVASIAANTSFAALVVNNNSTVGDLFTASSSGLSRFVIKNNGNVGIGTTAPSSFLLQTAGSIGPNANDGGTLGSGSLSFSDLFLASEGVINFNNGDVTLTHASDSLALAGGTLTVPDGTAAAPGIRTTTEAHGLFRQAAAALGVSIAGTERARFILPVATNAGPDFAVGDAVPTTNSVGNLTGLTASTNIKVNASANSRIHARFIAEGTNTASLWLVDLGATENTRAWGFTSDANQLTWGYLHETAGTTTNVVTLSTTSVAFNNVITPATSDVAALGTGSLMWSDLFLASGGIINLNNGDVTLTHASDSLAVDGGTLVINEAAGAISTPFRVEAQNNANLIYTDGTFAGGIGFLGIGGLTSQNAGVNVNFPARTLTAGEDYSTVFIRTSGAITVPLGTTSLVASLQVNAPTITATGTLSNAATLYIDGAPTAGTNKYSLWVDAGTSRFDGAIAFGDETVDIGTSTVGLNDLHFGSGGIINFDGGDVTVTHSANTLAFAGATTAYSFSDGNVGIGTTTPATFKLELAGSIGPSATNTYDLGSTSRQWANIYAEEFYDDGVLLTNYWQRNGTTLSPLTLTDSVGLGTTSPLATLDVRGNLGTSPVASISGNTAQAALIVDNRFSGGSGGDLFTASASGLARFVIKSNGRVGVGTGVTAPRYLLDLGTTDSAGDIAAAVLRDTANPTSYLLNLGSAPGGTALSTLGSIGVGVSAGTFTPSVLVNGNVAIGYSSLTTAPPSNGLAVSGNVGIGTTSTLAALDVRSGGATISGTLTANGVITASPNNNVRLQASGATVGNGQNGSIYFLDSSSATKGRVDTAAIEAGTGLDGNFVVGCTQASEPCAVTFDANPNTTANDGRTYLTADPAVGASTLTVNSTTGFGPGDEILVVQTVGSSSPGQYEFEIIATVTNGTDMTIVGTLANDYVRTVSSAGVQVIRVPQFQNVTVKRNTIWHPGSHDGTDTTTNGVIVFRAQGTVRLEASNSIISTSANSGSTRGFQGGGGGAGGGGGSNGGGVGTNGTAGVAGQGPDGTTSGGGGGGLGTGGAGGTNASCANPGCGGGGARGGGSGGSGAGGAHVSSPGAGSAGAAAGSGGNGATGVLGGTTGGAAGSASTGDTLYGADPTTRLNMGAGGGTGGGGAGGGGGGNGGGGGICSSSGGSGSAGTSGGTGGDGGGIIYIQATKLANSGTITAAGENGASSSSTSAGGNGGAGCVSFANTKGGGGGGGSGGSGGGGGGGAGGTIYLSVANQEANGTITAAGGTGGSTNSGGGGGGSGGAGTTAGVAGSNGVGTAGGAGGTARTSAGAATAGSDGRARIDCKTGTCSFTGVSGSTSEGTYTASNTANSYGILYIGAVDTSSADVAENYPVADQELGVVREGDVVSLIESLEGTGVLVRSQRAFDPQLLGVISTKPGLQLGSDEFGDKSKQKPVALVGRVPVNVSTENGTIKVGDAITASSLRGVAMKATQPGVIIGYALENLNTERTYACDPDDWTELKTGVTCGQIMVFVRAGYYDPRPPVIAISQQLQELALIRMDQAQVGLAPLASTSATMVNEATDTYNKIAYQVKDATGKVVEKVDVLASAVIGNLTAGFIDTQYIVADELEATRATIAQLNIGESLVAPLATIGALQTNIISPLPQRDGSIVIRLGEKNASSSGTPRLEIQNASGSAVATIDSSGNASFSGTLSSNELDVGNDASIGGTLRAKKIIADEIDLPASLREALLAGELNATSSANYITNVTNIYNAASDGLASQGETLEASATGTMATSSPYDSSYALDIASYSGMLAYTPTMDVEMLHASFGSFTQGFMSLGPSSFTDVTVAGQFSVGSQLILADNTINVLGSTLELQPLRQGNLSIMGGLVHIDTEGNLQVGGNATFAKDVRVGGILSANIIAPVPDQDLVIQLGGSNQRENHNSSFIIHNSSSSAVLSINQAGDLIASGAGTFTKLNLSLAPPALALSATEVIATGSAGIATMSAQKSELTIRNSQVTDKSLIYITPLGSTNNLVLFLLRQLPGVSFTVGVSQPNINAIPFNWMIVN